MAPQKRSEPTSGGKGKTACPVCGQPVARPPEGPAQGEAAGRREAQPFPFCSARCKLIDLGRWLGGEYRIELPQEAAESDAAWDVPLDDTSPEGTP